MLNYCFLVEIVYYDRKVYLGIKKFDVFLYFDWLIFFVDRCRILEFKLNRNKKNDKVKSIFKLIIKIKKVDCYLVKKKNKDLIYYLLIVCIYCIS